MAAANQICYDDVCFTGSGSVQPRPPQQSPGLTPPGRTPTPPGQPRSGSRGSGSSGSGSSGAKGSGGSGSGGQGGNGNTPIEIDDLIDGLDDPNFWMIQEMKRREAEMLAAMERAARSKKKAYSLLFARDDNNTLVMNLDDHIHNNIKANKHSVYKKGNQQTHRLAFTIPQFLIDAVESEMTLICGICSSINNNGEISPLCFRALGCICDVLCGGECLRDVVNMNHWDKGLFQRWLEVARDQTGSPTVYRDHEEMFNNLRQHLDKFKNDWENDRCNPPGGGNLATNLEVILGSADYWLDEQELPPAPNPFQIPEPIIGFEPSFEPLPITNPDPDPAAAVAALILLMLGLAFAG